MRTARYRRGILIALIVVVSSLIFRGVDALIHKPFIEDGFYALAIARNIGTGQGITIDGSTWTNGFQPLWVFAVAPVFAAFGGDRIASLYAIVGFHVLVYVLTALLLARLVAECFEDGEGTGGTSPDGRMFGWMAAALYLASLFVLEQHFNGLETGLYLLVLILVARCHQKGALASARGCAVLGALLGLLVLARIDSVFLVIILVAATLWSVRHEGYGEALLRAGLLGGVAFLVSSPWWVYNLSTFGSLVPISGTSQQWWTLEPRILWMRIPRAFHALVQVGAPWMPTLHLARLSTTLANLVRLLLVVLMIVVAVRARAAWPGSLRFSAAGRNVRRFAVAAASWILVLVGWYVFSSGASHFYDRYWAPLVLLSVAAWAVAASLALGPRTAGAAVLLLLVAQSLAVGSMHGDRVFRGNEFYRDQLPLVREHAAEGSVVAAAQTGTLGYFRDDVVNLDGKVNPAALGLGPAAIVDYLERHRATWFVDWHINALSYLGDEPEEAGWRPVASRGRFQLYRRAENSETEPAATQTGQAR